MAKISGSPVTKEKTYSETEQARNTMEYFIREWAEDQNELSICEYLLGLVEEQEDFATRREKLISRSMWISVGACYAVSSGSFCTSMTQVLPIATKVMFLFKSDTHVSLKIGNDEGISFAMPIQQFLNMFKPIPKKKAKKKETQ